MRDLATGRIAATQRRLRLRLPDDFTHRAHGLMQIRLLDLERDPGARPWLLRFIVLRGNGSPATQRAMPRRTAVGMIGFHGRPDEEGRAEIGYEVFAAHRHRGYATEAVVGLLDWAGRRHGVRTFLAAIAPDNEPSMRLALGLGFRQVGAQVDDEGLEFIYELSWSRGRPHRSG